LNIWRFKSALEAQNKTVYSGDVSRNFSSGIIMSIKKGKTFSVNKMIKLNICVKKEQTQNLTQMD
jgi:hypothetical protein